MSTSRLEQLIEFEIAEPNDPFILYAIAIEYQKFNDAKAMEYFKKLLIEHEGYTGTYYQAAKFYETIGNIQEAKSIYQKGIEICRNAGKNKAVSELMSAYNQLCDEEMDY